MCRPTTPTIQPHAASSTWPSEPAQLTYPPQLETVLDMVTVNAARAMRLERYGTELGDRADIVPVDAPRCTRRCG